MVLGNMSCPHVAGFVGLLKILHPTWSPVTIKSAIMTSGSLVIDSYSLLEEGFVDRGINEVEFLMVLNRELFIQLHQNDLCLFFVRNQRFLTNNPKCLKTWPKKWFISAT